MQRAMEAASFSLCRAFPAPRTAVHEAAKAPFVSFHTHSSSALNFTPPCKKTRVIRTVVPVKASADNANSSTSQLLGLLLEVEGKAGGDEKRMLVLFFNGIGWPTSLPTNEKENFMKSVLREKKNALDELAMTEQFSLRPGVEDFIDDAFNEGVPVVFLAAYSKNGEKMARAVIGKLGHERISKIKVVGKEEVDGSFYGQLVLGKGVSSTLDEQLAREAVKAASVEKQRIAKEVASMLKLSVDIDTIPAESLDKIMATLRAGAESASVPVSNCVLIAGSQSGLLGAERVGMPCVVLRNSVTARAEFSSANAVMDGFGGGDLTLSKLKQKRWS